MLCGQLGVAHVTCQGVLHSKPDLNHPWELVSFVLQTDLAPICAVTISSGPPSLPHASAISQGPQLKCISLEGAACMAELGSRGCSADAP
jgi:hypothetical protein